MPSSLTSAKNRPSSTLNDRTYIKIYICSVSFTGDKLIFGGFMVTFVNDRIQLSLSSPL